MLDHCFELQMEIKVVTLEGVVNLLRLILNEVPEFKGYGKKEAAAWALGMIGPAGEAAVPDLIKHLRSADTAETKAECLAALGRIVFSPPHAIEHNSPHRVEVVGVAVPFLLDESERVQREAAWVIRFSDSDAIHVLSEIITALNTAPPEVAECLAMAVGNIGPEGSRAIPALKQAAISGRLEQAILHQVLGEIAVPYDEDLEDDDEGGEGEEWKESLDPDDDNSRK